MHTQARASGKFTQKIVSTSMMAAMNISAVNLHPLFLGRGRRANLFRFGVQGWHQVDVRSARFTFWSCHLKPITKKVGKDVVSVPVGHGDDEHLSCASRFQRRQGCDQGGPVYEYHDVSASTWPRSILNHHLATIQAGGLGFRSYLNGIRRIETESGPESLRRSSAGCWLSISESYCGSVPVDSAVGGARLPEISSSEDGEPHGPGGSRITSFQERGCSRGPNYHGNQLGVIVIQLLELDENRRGRLVG